MKFNKWAILPVSLSALLLVACNNSQAPTETAEPANSNVEQTIKIATESSFKPFSYTDAEGNLVGFEIDLANALCEQMKVQCEISSQEWDGLIPGLQAKKFDAIMAGMSVTEERQQVVDFTDPYFQNTLALIGKKGSTTTIDKLTGEPIAVQRATVSADYLTDNYPNTNIKMYDTQDNAYLDLVAGRAQYMLSDIIPVSDWLKSDAGQDFEIIGTPIDIDDEIAIAVRKDDSIINQFNTALAELKANGKYDKIAEPYFGTDQPVTKVVAEASQTQATDTK